MSDDLDPQLEAAGNPEDARPEWLPENFTKPEDLARSYQEAQRKITELATEKRGLEESIQSLSSQFEEFTAQQSRPDPNQVYSQWQEAFESDPIGTVAQIAQATATQVHQQYAQQNQQPSVAPEVVAFIADQTMEKEYADWEAYKPKVRELIASDPLYAREDLYSNPELATRALTSAYNVVKAQDVLSGDAVVQQQVADTRAMKLQAQTAQGASGRPPAASTEQEEWARIKAAAPKNYWE